MNITLTGSLGHIGQPLTYRLLKQGHAVTVISTQEAKAKEIISMGARAAIGTVEDPAFLAEAFSGADIVYCMEPPVDFFDKELDIFAWYQKIAGNFVQAILASGVKQVVHLSSIGAHMASGNGLLRFHYEIEQIMQQLPDDVGITFMRPVGFYYNMLGFIHSIRSQGAIISNYKAGYKEPWVAPSDIAAAIADVMNHPVKGRSIRYVASEELSGDDIAAILGEAIGKPDLRWVTIPDEAMLQGMMAAGMSHQAATGLVEMNAARQTGALAEDYFRNRPVLGETKLKDFAAEFAAAYHK
ncbi:MAG TPA: NmrA family NAD(P)-binding protein [Flavipsychrobacter sp.]|nr:NmrA family NAD(P)-binding protein [Flavipsychrobacter sp.]